MTPLEHATRVLTPRAKKCDAHHHDLRWTICISRKGWAAALNDATSTTQVTLAVTQMHEVRRASEALVTAIPRAIKMGLTGPHEMVELPPNQVEGGGV